MNSQRAVVAIDTPGSAAAADSALGADPDDKVIQQLYALGLAMQITQRREQSPEQAVRINDHIDQLHDVLEQLRKPAG